LNKQRKEKKNTDCILIQYPKKKKVERRCFYFYFQGAILKKMRKRSTAAIIEEGRIIDAIPLRMSPVLNVPSVGQTGRDVRRQISLGPWLLIFFSLNTYMEP